MTMVSHGDRIAHFTTNSFIANLERYMLTGTHHTTRQYVLP